MLFDASNFACNYTDMFLSQSLVFFPTGHYKWALTQLFNKRGFRRVIILEGGWSSWVWVSIGVSYIHLKNTISSQILEAQGVHQLWSYSYFNRAKSISCTDNSTGAHNTTERHKIEYTLLRYTCLSTASIRNGCNSRFEFLYPDLTVWLEDFNWVELYWWADDMEIAPDFFDYFEATASLLTTDKWVWCSDCNCMISSLWQSSSLEVIIFTSAISD